MIQKYRKKPVIIEAIRRTDSNHDEISKFCEGNISPQPNPVLFIRTLEGLMRVNVGDWVIKGIKGEFYPCKNDIFEMTYELAE